MTSKSSVLMFCFEQKIVKYDQKLMKTIVQEIRALHTSINHLTFPETCLHCSNELIEKEDFICNFCYLNLQFTNFEKPGEINNMDKLFWGKLPIHSAFALLFFEENSAVQKIIHALKYHNNAKIGIIYGKMIGEKISQIQSFNNLDALLPVPIHPVKKFRRGYNQAELIAKGISEILTIPVRNNVAQKIIHTESQTQKSLWERWQNSQNIFYTKTELKEYKHIGLVDDVLTTGSTMERFAESLRIKNPFLKISVITLAVTK